MLGIWFQRNGAAYAKEQKPFDILLKNGNIRGLKEEQREWEFNLEISNKFKLCDSLNESALWVMQHSLKLIRYLTGNQCKDLRRGVICNKWEVCVTILAIEFCTFCKR